MATCFPGDPGPAFVEFALLEYWLASSSALQLSLHQIESQQQAGGAVIYSHRRLSTRSLTTVFGTVEIVRMGYSRPSAPSVFPLDKALALPARSFSYELQRRLVKAAVQNPFLESVQTLPN